MARPKEFDPGQATREAMEAFWENGYGATSVSDLLSEMKLNRGSLYGTFGDKRQLFLAALDEYERIGLDALGLALERPGSPRQAIVDWFTAAALGCTGDAGRRGCLAAKAAMEVAPHDAEVARWLRKFHQRHETLIAAAVERARQAGELHGTRSTRAVARYLLSVLGGLHLLGTTAPDINEVKDVVALTLDSINQC